MRRLSFLLLSALIFSACNCGGTKAGTSTGSTSATSGGSGSSGSTGTSGTTGSSGATTTGSSTTGSTCPTSLCNGVCCPSSTICSGTACVEAGSTCTSDAACQSDAHCVGGQCVPWPDGGYDATCSHPVEPPHFSPSIRCAWPDMQTTFPDPQWIQVITTPVVADFKLFPTAHPMVVFPTQNSLGGGSDECVGNATNYGVLRILDPQSCQVVATLDAADQHVIGSSTPAIGDLDGDGRPEIVASAVGGGLVAFTYDASTQAWKTLWHSTDASGNPSNLNATVCQWAGPSIADVDGDGLPEIVFGAVIHDHNGKIIGSSQGMVPYGPGQIPVLADVDLDAGPELITGNKILTYDPTLKDFTPAPYFNTSQPDGYTAVARFGDFPMSALPGTGYPQIAVVGGGQVRVQNLDGTVLFGPYNIPTSSGGGPPTIGDFNGDGQPDIAAAASDSFTVFSFHCVADGGVVPSDCQGDGILWSKGSQDHSSNVTGSSLFDFTGSGRVNGVYADECFARVYDGKTGQVIYSQSHSSCTWYENPVVADVLANYSSQLIVGSNQNCGVDCSGSTEDDGTGRRVDRYFDGLTCQTAADCPSSSDTCVGGLCRCTTDDGCCSSAGNCPAEGFVCAPPPTAADPASGNTCRAVHNGAYAGIRIYADAQDRWADSRSIWNQHAYAVTNVNDDGTIPGLVQSKHNWLVAGLNNFRQNVQGQLTPLAAAHLTVAFTQAQCGTNSLTLSAEVCNRGASGVVGGIPVDFSTDQGTAICEGSTSGPLGPGACQTVSCTGPQPSSFGSALVAVVDPTGTTRPCDGAENVSTLPGFGCLIGR